MLAAPPLHGVVAGHADLEPGFGVDRQDIPDFPFHVGEVDRTIFPPHVRRPHANAVEMHSRVAEHRGLPPQGGAVAVPVLRRVVERRLEPSAADVKIRLALLVDDLADGLGLALHRLQRLLHPNRTRGEDGVPARALIWQHKLRHVGKGHPRHRQHVGERPCGLPSRIVEIHRRPSGCGRAGARPSPGGRFGRDALLRVRRIPPTPIRVHIFVTPICIRQNKREADPAAPGHVAPLHRQDMPPRTFQRGGEVLRLVNHLRRGHALPAIHVHAARIIDPPPCLRPHEALAGFEHTAIIAHLADAVRERLVWADPLHDTRRRLVRQLRTRTSPCHHARKNQADNQFIRSRH